MGQLVIRVLGASTKIIDKWDEMAFLRDVTIAAKDQEVEESRKLLKETKQRQTQLEKEKKENLAEIARLEQNLDNLRATNKEREQKSKDLKKEFTAVKAASEGNTILKNTLEKVHGEFDGTLKETEGA